MEKTNLRELLLRWVLGELPPEESERIDQQFLTDEAFADRLHEEYIELLDAYGCGELSKAEQERVQRAIVQSPEQQKNLLFARIFKDKERQTGFRGTPEKWRWLDISWRWRIAAFAVCVLAIAVLFLGHYIPSAKQAQQSSGTSPAPMVTPQSNSKASVHDPISFALVLSSSITRGEAPVRIFTIPKNVDVLDIQAIVKSKDQPYRMKIVNATGDTIASSSDLIPEELHAVNFVRYIVPISQLPAGTYHVFVGKEDNQRASNRTYSMQIAYK